MQPPPQEGIGAEEQGSNGSPGCSVDAVAAAGRGRGKGASASLEQEVKEVAPSLDPSDSRSGCSSPPPVFAGVVAGIAMAIPRRHRPPPPPDDYTVALHMALMFFNAQRCHKLPKHNNVPWRSNSCMKDGLSDPAVWRSLVGGYYDAGNAVVVHLSSFSRLLYFVSYG